MKELTKGRRGMSRGSRYGQDGDVTSITEKYKELEQKGEEFVDKMNEVERILDYMDANPALDGETRRRYIDILKLQKTQMTSQYVDAVQLQREILDEQMEDIASDNDEQKAENDKVAAELSKITSSEVNLEGVRDAQKEATEKAKEHDVISKDIRNEVKLRQQFAEMQARKLRIDSLRGK